MILQWTEKGCVCLSQCTLLRYSELRTGCGWIYSRLSVVSRQGAVFSAPASYHWLRAAGVRKAKVPGQLRRACWQPHVGRDYNLSRNPPPLLPPTINSSLLCQHPTSPQWTKTKSPVYDGLFSEWHRHRQTQQSLNITQYRIFCLTCLWPGFIMYTYKSRVLCVRAISFE